MKQKINKLLSFQFTAVILLTLIIILQICNIVNVFVNDKKGFHSDEVFSYGLSNSFYGAYIQSDFVDDTDNMKNINKWISGDVLREYITVQSGEQFRYDSVWYNQEHDRHPPFYYTVLHTICSFFPDTFSWWYGFLLNLAIFVIIQIFLYKLARNLLKSKYMAVLVCLVWGFSAAATDMTIFIRMYGMLAMWVVILIYLHSKLYKTKEKPLFKQLIPIILVTVCGTLTQHLFLFVAFVTAVCFCIRYLVTKRFKVFFAYGFSMLGGVVLAFLIFPTSISQLFSEADSAIGTRFLYQLDISFRFILADIFNTSWVDIVWFCTILFGILLWIAIFSIPIVFLIRKNPKVAIVLDKVKNFFASIPSTIKNFKFSVVWKKVSETIKKSNPIIFIMFLSSIAVIMITSYTVSFMIGYVNRYFFIVYPIILLTVISVVYFILAKCKFRKHIVCILFSFVALNSFIGGTLSYLFNDNTEREGIKEMTADSECIIVTETREESWLIATFTNEIYYANSVFITNFKENTEYINEIDSITTDKPIYLIVSKGIIENDQDGKEYMYFNNPDDKIDMYEYLDMYKNLKITDEMSYICDYTIFTRDYMIYRLS